MNAKDVIRNGLDMGRFITNAYLGDLSDAEILMRPAKNANHIAWQLGHLIASERKFMTDLGHAMPELPAGFAERHTKETSGADDPRSFAKKAEYVAYWEKIRTGTLAALGATPDADLDKPAPEHMRSYAPTVGAVFNLIGLHEIMHTGQYVPLRRSLNKPIVM